MHLYHLIMHHTRCPRSDGRLLRRANDAIRAEGGLHLYFMEGVKHLHMALRFAVQQGRPATMAVGVLTNTISVSTYMATVGCEGRGFLPRADDSTPVGA